MAVRTRSSEVAPFATKDGSIVREFMHPSAHGNANQSLAEARVAPASRTALHRHHRSEELYHIVVGRGVVTVGEDEVTVVPGDTVLIPPGTPHRIRNLGRGDLVFLCCSAPAYSHEDTELLEPAHGSQW